MILKEFSSCSHFPYIRGYANSVRISRCYTIKEEIMTKIFRFTFLCLILTALSGCQKNSFESCVEYYQNQAKKESPKNWEQSADLSIRLNCKVR